ncbi:MAG TPA: tRNA 2-thiouridine(34) synthase MnmA [Chloroflexota bacterium]|nr:tRNA 2-thiouridine(34) synthase MnmA [Chloroflexota bacterium]
MTQQRVVVGMSGGVDSAVSAALLKEQGYDVIGVTLNLSPKVNDEDAWERDDSCCGLSASEDARRVADRIGIPHYVLNFRDVFAEKVIANFLDEYRRGRTPNPCIRCNDHIKFGTVLLKARALDADLVATGHYVRVQKDPETGRHVLRRAIDLRKDQSYVLYVLNQEELRRTLFPLGELTKAETRDLARKYQLSVAEKPESQDICFVNEGNYGDFLKKLAPDIAEPGPIVDLDGRVLGEHRGIAFYTIGQRRGLGVVSSDPLYVIDVDAASRTIVVGPETALFDYELIADEANFVQFGAIPEPLPIKARVRYRMVDAEATVQQIAPEKIKVRFAQPQRAITPGQAVVCYADDVVVAGGTITATNRTRRMDGLFQHSMTAAS